MAAPDEQEGGSFWRTGLGYLTQAGIVLGAVAAIVGALTTLFGGSDSDHTPTPRLRTIDLAVSGGHRAVCAKDKPDPQRLDVTVGNVGDQPALLKRLGLRVRATGLLTIPQAGGGLEPSKNYDILLPSKPRIGQVVQYKLSQEVEPKANDRFTVRLEQPEPARQVGDRLYQLDVLLYHDTEQAPLKAGTALVAAPFLPDKSFFPSGVAPANRADLAGSEPLRTMKSNERTLRRMLALHGERAPELNTDLVNVPVTGTEASPCLPSGRSRPGTTAQPPLSEP